MTADFHREVDKNCSVPSYYAASNGNFLQTFQDYLSVPPSRIKKMGPIGCLEMLALLAA